MGRSLAFFPLMNVASASPCLSLQAAGEYRRYLADWWGDAINAVSAAGFLPLQAAGEYRRYLADWWGDAIKAEFEERKHEAG